MVRSWAEGSGAIGSDRPVGGGGDAVAERGDAGVGGWAVAGAEHPHVVAHAPQGAGQAEHLPLDAAGEREAVGADDADAHESNARWPRAGGPGSARAAPKPAARKAASSLGQLGCWRCHWSGARRMSASSSWARHWVSGRRRRGSDPAGSRSHGRAPHRRGGRRPRSTPRHGMSGAPVRSARVAGPGRQGGALAEELAPATPSPGDVAVGQQADHVVLADGPEDLRAGGGPQGHHVHAQVPTEPHEELEQLDGLDRLDDRGHLLAHDLPQPEGRPLPATEVRQRQHGSPTRVERPLQVLVAVVAEPRIELGQAHVGESERLHPVAARTTRRSGRPPAPARPRSPRDRGPGAGGARRAAGAHPTCGPRRGCRSGRTPRPPDPAALGTAPRRCGRGRRRVRCPRVARSALRWSGRGGPGGAEAGRRRPRRSGLATRAVSDPPLPAG